MITDALLRAIRNDLPMRVTLGELGRRAPPSKFFEGHLRFLCPGCGELRATVNPANNLAHCFCCGRNLNNIDLLMSLDHDFLSAVQLLGHWLRRHQERQARARPAQP